MLTFGQFIGRIYNIPSVTDLMKRIVGEAQEVLRASVERFQRWVSYRIRSKI